MKTGSSSATRASAPSAYNAPQSRPSTDRTQSRANPPLTTAAIAYQSAAAPAVRYWWNAQSAYDASGCSMIVSACAPVPTLRSTVPGRSMPRPSSAAAASPAPIAIGVFGGIPSCSARGPVTPARAVDGFSSANAPVGMPIASTTWCDQVRAPTSYNSDADASLWSVDAEGDCAVESASSPRSQSFGVEIDERRLHTCGSLRRIHASTGPGMPGTNGLPSTPGWARSMASNSLTSACARRSCHRIAGRRRSPAASSTTVPCICPLKPMARTCFTSSPGAALMSANEGLPPQRRIDLGSVADEVCGVRLAADPQHRAARIDEHRLH